MQILLKDQAMTETAEKYRTTAVALNIRQNPVNSAKILGHLSKGEVITKLALSADGYWIKHRTHNVEGWSSKNYLTKVQELPVADGNFPWLPIAEKEKGVIEIPGTANAPRVLEYLKTVTNIGPTWTSKDETPWCSAFVNWCVEKAGFTGTKSALSTSWLKWGQPIDKPVKGCLAIFLREGGGGHVGFFIEEVPTLSEIYIKLLGGNQEHGDTDIGEVNERHYRKSKLLGYRIPLEYKSASL
jgi:uncharacterized protein (TIGR02594 family)